jgi:hypothetical protein
MVRRPIQIRIPVDLSRGVDGSPAALLRWQGLSRPEREVLAWYVDKTWTRWGRRRRLSQVLRFLTSGESVDAWQQAPPRTSFTDLFGFTRWF